jgi:hypothetical protein
VTDLIPNVAEAAKAAKETLPVAAQYPWLVALISAVVLACGALYIAHLTIKSQTKTANRLAESYDRMTDRLTETVSTCGKAVDATGKKVENLNLDVEKLQRQVNLLEETIDELQEQLLSQSRKAG